MICCNITNRIFNRMNIGSWNSISSNITIIVNNNSTGSRSSRFRRVLLPISNGNTIYLSSNDAPAGTLVQISTIMGNDIASCLAKEDYSQRGDYKSGRSYIDISHLTPGHYSLYIVNKKGYRHLLGSFSVPFK